MTTSDRHASDDRGGRGDGRMRRRHASGGWQHDHISPRPYQGATMVSAYEAPVIRAPRGTAITCKGWQQEAAMRMLMNNLDPDVAERPRDLVVYGGTGKAARDWPSFWAIIAAL